MYESVGKKIKGVAIFLCILGITLSIVGGVIYCKLNINAYGDGYVAAEEKEEQRTTTIIITIIIIAGGSLLSWVSNIVLAGFGELVQDTEEISDLVYNMSLTMAQISKNTEQITEYIEEEMIGPMPNSSTKSRN